MKKISLGTNALLFEDINRLSDVDKNLMKFAVKATKDAYAPYSKFSVGAALLMEDDTIITGNNQENAAYPSGLCAERVAIFYAGSQYPEATVHSMAISAKSLNSKTTKAVPPCGACRQVLAEYEVKQNSLIEIYFMGESGKVLKSSSVKDLLPLIFDSTFL